MKPSVLSHVPREIILHHHERLDGGGYPHRLGGNELLEEVKIAAFADVFDALTSNRPYQMSRTRFEARGRMIDATVFPVDGIRQSPYSPVDGRPMRRADVKEVVDLLQSG